MGSVDIIQGEERLRDIFTPEEPGAAEAVTSVCFSRQHPSFSKDQDDKKKRKGKERPAQQLKLGPQQQKMNNGGCSLTVSPHSAPVGEDPCS
jgi:hypothetical protein